MTSHVIGLPGRTVHDRNMTNTAQAANVTTTPDASATGRLEASETVAGYFECWNADSEDARASAIRRFWTEDATSTDPLSDVAGHSAIQEMMAAVFETYAGHSFRQVGAVDAHHDMIRWGWEMLDPQGVQVLEGIDTAQVDDTGRITQLSGFFGAAVPTVEP